MAVPAPVSDRFTGQQFIAELERHGLGVDERFVQRVLGDFVIGVATKASADGTTSVGASSEGVGQ